MFVLRTSLRTIVLALPAKRAFGRGYFAGGTRVDAQGRSQGARERFEARLGNMMVIGAVERFDMQCNTGIHGTSLKPLLHQFGIEGADLVQDEGLLEHHKRTAGDS